MVKSKLGQDLYPVERSKLIHKARPILGDPPISALPPIHLIRDILHDLILGASSHIKPAISLVINRGQVCQREDLINGRDVARLLHIQHVHEAQKRAPPVRHNLGQHEVPLVQNLANSRMKWEVQACHHDTLVDCHTPLQDWSTRSYKASTQK